MTGTADVKLAAALAECKLHAATLGHALDDAALLRPFDPDRMAGLSEMDRRLLDQIAYRFTRLQDSLGEKVLPGLLELSQDPMPESVPFAQKLQRLERLGAVASVEQWRVLREMRNALAHDYPDDPAIQAAFLNRLLAATEELLRFEQRARDFAERLAT